MDFNEQAKNWDTDKRAARAMQIADEIRRAIDGTPETALEFGCGTGLVSFCLMDMFKQITLIDTSSGMIEMLNEKIQVAGVKNMTAMQWDLNAHPVMPQKFDVVYTSLALHHIPDTKTTLHNLYNLLHANGTLCIVELDEEDGRFHQSEVDYVGHNGFNQADLKRMMETIGFNGVYSTVFLRDEKMVDDTAVPYALFLMVGVK